MTVKQHYDNHLANFYSWYMGDYSTAKNTFIEFCSNQQIIPSKNKKAIDLGAGNGIQSLAMADLGYEVMAIDFSKELLNELENRKENKPIDIHYGDIRDSGIYNGLSPELIVCAGDTLAHLDTFKELEQLILDAYHALIGEGRLVLAFRDYSNELLGSDRFIPVKSDGQKILTCILEYFNDRVRVTDLLHEKTDGEWIQKVSSYFKLRITREQIVELMTKAGFKITCKEEINKLWYLVGEKE